MEIQKKQPPGFPFPIEPAPDDELAAAIKQQPTFPFPAEPAEQTELLRKQILFTGEWNPSEDPLKIGEQNYATLQNLRYRDVGLEGVPGYSKINTTPLATYLKGRSGIQLRSPHTIKSYTFIQAENTGETASRILENRTAVPSAGDFEAAALHTDAAGAGLGRFATWPDGHIAYCNGKESLLYAGDEMACAGFFTLKVPTYTGTGVTTFSKTAAPDTIVTSSGNFRALGFKTGQQIIVATSSGTNDGEYLITAVSADGATLTLEDDVLKADEAAGAVVVSITVNEKRDCREVKDYTDRINSDINSDDESALLTGADTEPEFRWLILTTRHLTGVQYQIRTPNATISTLTCKTWTGAAFEAVSNPSDGTADEGKSLAQNGVYTFDSTVGTAQPLHIEGYYLYAYLFELSAGSARVYQVTLRAPIQAVLDAWDGIFRMPIQCQVGEGAVVDPEEGETITSEGTICLTFCDDVPDYYCAAVTSKTDYDAIEVGAQITGNGHTGTVAAKIGYYEGGYGYLRFTDHTPAWFPATVGGECNAGCSFTYLNSLTGLDEGAYKDYTLEVAEPSYAGYPIGAVLEEFDSAHRIYLAFEERQSGIRITMIPDNINVNDAKISIGYYNGTGFSRPQGLCDTTTGNNVKTLNQAGLITWQPPDETDEFMTIRFGVHAWWYEVTVDAALSGPLDEEAEEEEYLSVIIDTIKGIPAQHSIKAYKFPAMFGDTPLLCGYLDGKQGNRIDYGAPGTHCVFNGEDSSNGSRGPLRFGGLEPLTAFSEVYARAGLQMTMMGIVTKATETYALVGNTIDDWQIHTLSATIGCPAPLTMDSFDIGASIAGEPMRKVVMWMSYAGPVLFENAVLDDRVGEKVRCYWDKTDERCINYEAIERCLGKFDPDTSSYHLLIPSGAGQTTLNVWLVYDLVRKKWYEIVPAAAGELDPYPQALIRVADDDGAEYLYGFRDDGYLLRLGHGTSWDSEGIVQTVKLADHIPTGDAFDYTLIRRLKLFAVAIEEDIEVTVHHYANGSGAYSTLNAVDLVGARRFIKDTQNINLKAWSHQFEIAATTAATEKGFQPLGLAYQYRVIRVDGSGGGDDPYGGGTGINDGDGDAFCYEDGYTEMVLSAAAPALISTGEQEIEITVENGQAPFIWSVVAGDAQFEKETTWDRVNTLLVEIGCDPISIQITDYCVTKEHQITRDFLEECLDLDPEFFEPSSQSTITLVGGVPPFSWSISGTGFSLAFSETAGPENTLILGPSACGTAVVEVTDACGNTCYGYPKSTSGKWSNRPKWVKYKYADSCADGTASFCSAPWEYFVAQPIVQVFDCRMNLLEETEMSGCSAYCLCEHEWCGDPGNGCLCDAWEDSCAWATACAETKTWHCSCDAPVYDVQMQWGALLDCCPNVDCNKDDWICP
jgi:hypothetical protein